MDRFNETFDGSIKPGGRDADDRPFPDRGAARRAVVCPAKKKKSVPCRRRVKKSTCIRNWYSISSASYRRRESTAKIASGVSPRGTLAFLRAVQGHALVQGRNYVVPEDFKTVAVPVLAHRLTMQIGADDGRAAESVIEEILNRIDLPTENWSGR